MPVADAVVFITKTGLPVSVAPCWARASWCPVQSWLHLRSGGGRNAVSISGLFSLVMLRQKAPLNMRPGGEWSRMWWSPEYRNSRQQWKTQQLERASDEAKLGTERVQIIQKMLIHYILTHSRYRELRWRGVLHIGLFRIRQQRAIASSYYPDVLVGQLVQEQAANGDIQCPLKWEFQWK